MSFHRVSEVFGFHQGVVVPPTDLVRNHKAHLDEVPDDHLHGPLGDPDSFGDVPHPRLRVQRQADQHVAVIGEQSPTRLADHTRTIREFSLVRQLPVTRRSPPGTSSAHCTARRDTSSCCCRSTKRGSSTASATRCFLPSQDPSRYLRLHSAPLVLVGAERTLSRFTHVSRNLGRLAGTVHGNYTRSPLSQLAELIRPILVGYLHSRQDEALQLLESRAGSARVLAGMPAVWLAARTERPEMLAVEAGLFYPARLSSDGDFITIATDVDHPDVIDDLVDEVIETVLQRGGWVALVDDGALSVHDGIALSVRRS